MAMAMAITITIAITIHITLSLYISLYLSLSLSLYKYIHIHIRPTLRFPAKPPPRVARVGPAHRTRNARVRYGRATPDPSVRPLGGGCRCLPG